MDEFDTRVHQSYCQRLIHFIKRVAGQRNRNFVPLQSHLIIKELGIHSIHRCVLIHRYILAMQRFRLVYRRISHESLVFSRIHTSLQASVYAKKNPRDEWNISRIYRVKGLHNYLIPCHRKYSGKMGRLGVLQLNCTDRWEGSVEY